MERSLRTATSDDRERRFVKFVIIVMEFCLPFCCLFKQDLEKGKPKASNRDCVDQRGDKNDFKASSSIHAQQSAKIGYNPPVGRTSRRGN